ncbi:MAG: MoxR family ATPase [Nitrospira sp.]|nr:MoxR family ATPase [Nitrospira sp.]
MNSTQTIRSIQDNISRVIKGKPLVIEMTVVALLARGHLLLEDVPGVGKTTLAHSLARSLDCSFKRIQFTSDLLPSDIVGVSIFNRQKQGFEFMPGPIFANIVLADEINRTTPKTQSSLLEAMSEAQISVDNQTYPLSQPFMVIATQNPSEYHGTFPLPESQLDRFLMRLRIGYPSPDEEQPFMVIATQNPSEYHGTFPLPESQLDRFLMRLRIGYPSLEEERKVLDRASSLHPAEDLEPVVTAQDVLDLQAQVDKVFVEESLTEYLLSIVQATRQSELLSLGVSTRGALALSRTAKALALVRGRSYCLPDDIKELAPTVLSHRIMVARSQGIRQRSFEQAERIIQDLVESIPVPV